MKPDGRDVELLSKLGAEDVGAHHSLLFFYTLKSSII